MTHRVVWKCTYIFLKTKQFWKVEAKTSQSMIIPHWSYPAAPPLLDSVQGIASLSPAPAVKFGCFNFFHVALDYILAQIRKFQISWTLLLRIINWSHFQFPVVQAFNPAEERRREEISGVRPPILTVIETSPFIKMIHLVNICPRRKHFLFLGNFLSHKTIVFLLWKNIFSVQRELQRYLLLSDRFHGSRDTHQCYHLILDNKNKKKDKLTLVKVVNT